MRRSALLILLVAAGCRSSAFDGASRSDTPESYREFLRKHPRDENAEAATARLAELEFTEAAKVHSVVAYKRYLEEFPDSAKAPAAESLLEGLRFNAAKEKGTAFALRQFLRDHPAGKHREEAQRLLDGAELREVSGLSDADKLRRIIAERADDPRRVHAEDRLDDGAFAEAKATGAAKLLAYLRDFPAGAHRDEAKALLFGLELDGLLFSGMIEEAREKASRSPLAKAVPDLERRFRRAEEDRAALRPREPLAQSALPAHYLRPVEDLSRALSAPDALDRWQAAEELGQHVTVRALEPLLGALRARHPLVRQRALESLGALVRALPPAIAEHELATRIDSLRQTAEDAQLRLVLAILLDLAGDLEAAAVEYQRAFDHAAPDPLVLRRWAELRRERGQHFSAAVAARQLALWAHAIAREEGTPTPAAALAASRQLCAAAEASRFALEVISGARRHPSEFPEDLAEFEARALDANRLVEARLRDAELVLRTEQPGARGCDDRQVSERVREGERARLEALEAVRSKLPRLAPTLLRLARERDPSPKVRAAAAGPTP